MRKARSISYGRSEKGPVRSENQDQFFIADLARSMDLIQSSLPIPENSLLRGDVLGHLFLVADGMGGHRGGKEASEYAIQHFVTSILNSVRWIVKVDQMSGERFLNDLQLMLTNAHRAIQNLASEDPTLEGMGTTITIGYVTWPRMTVVHAGDTRCYVSRNGKLQLITRDHTVANQLIRSGQLQPQSENRSPWANVLVNALGAGADDVVADIYQVNLELGDRVMFCSDGLNKHVDDSAIGEMLSKATSPKEATDLLVNSAIEAGGSDNVTVIVADFLANENCDTMNVRHSQCPDEKPIYSARIPEDDVDTTSSMNIPSTSNSDIPTSEFFADLDN